MPRLFFDTSAQLKVGLLDENYNWIDFKKIETKKISQVIHYEIFSMLEKRNLSVKDIDKVFTISGPGSYTGMRISNGISDVFNFSGIETYSFYSYEVPSLSLIDDYFWITKAFKGEVFIYRNKHGDIKKELIEINKVQLDELKQENVYSDGSFAFNGVHLKDVSSLILENSKLIFQSVESNKLKRESYYFRDLDKEFSKKA